MKTPDNLKLFKLSGVSLLYKIYISAFISPINTSSEFYSNISPESYSVRRWHSGFLPHPSVSYKYR